MAELPTSQDLLALDLSTEVQPTIPFAVDGATYQVLGWAHFSPLEASKFRALIQRENRLLGKLDELGTAYEDPKFIGLSEKVHQTRLDMLCMGTTLPKQVAERLSPGQMARLIALFAEDPQEVIKGLQERKEREERRRQELGEVEPQGA